MSDTNHKFAALLHSFESAGREPHYLAFFDCFNNGRYFEAHEVLECLWLKTPGENHAFYKGLIQLAGAFVHVQKQRKGPALALLQLARKNLERYSPVHEGLDVASLLNRLCSWSQKIRDCPHGTESALLRTEAPALSVNPAPIPVE